MVHVYNCHPFRSQQIVQVEQEPGLVCCGGGALFVVATGGCKVEVYNLEKEGCPLFCRFATMGTVKSIQHSKIGDYLVTIEEKNNATYLRAYTNWRFQAEEKGRVGVRLLGHLLGGASVWGGVQMEIIEIPMSERPIAVSCCPVTGDLLVGCEKTVVLFTLSRQNQQNLQNQSQQSVRNSLPNSQQSCNQSQGPTSVSNPNLSILDFERSVILHLPKMSLKQVALSGGYVAVNAELEVLVLKLEAASDPAAAEEPLETSKSAAEPPQDQDDFLLIPRHQELLESKAKDCDILVTMEKTGLEDQAQYQFSYILFRRFSPEFFQGCRVEEMQIHSLQLYPLFTSNSLEDPTCVFCFFSLPNAGYLYSLKGGVELLSAYQYPEKVLQAVMSDHLLHVITKNALQCFTVRCSAVAARMEDPYIDTTMKACPPSTLEVCALRIQLFIGLRSVCVYNQRVILLSAADTETQQEPERRGLSRKWTISSPKETSTVGHGWNLYVVDTVHPFTLYQEMVEYSCRYVQTTPQSHSLRHLLSEAHLLLRACLLQTPEQKQSGEGDPAVSSKPCSNGAVDKNSATQANRQELEEALRQNSAQLGDCFSRASQKDCHLALPYYKMSGLTVAEVISRNRPPPEGPSSYGLGFLFYLKLHLLEETEQHLTQEEADEIIYIFSQSEPFLLVSVCASPCMINCSATRTLQILQHLEDTAGVSVPLTIIMAAMALRLGKRQDYTELMERHAEMQLVYGFIEEPRLLLHGGGGGGGQHSQVHPTSLARQLANTQPGLLVAAMVALHENCKVQLEQADFVFKELGCENTLLVDFWEAMLMALSQDAVIQELLFRVASVYIDRLTNSINGSGAPHYKSLKGADDLITSCSHYGALYPWLTVLNPTHSTTSEHQEALRKLQSLLCGPSLSVGSIVPLLERLSEETLWGFSLHLLCATRRGQYESSIEQLLDRCPQAIIAYANHQLQDKYMTLWWQKLLPELCKRTRAAADNGILLGALKETLVVVAMETSPAEFLELIPDDGTASYFLPHLLTCSQRHLMA
uniref:HPS3 biogenesis of lysosomal organelles complex 2 subunit 1 n=1 Tax=Oryzias latipes TaxID=8090 RepID=A0A3P9LTJ5_ORYLA